MTIKASKVELIVEDDELLNSFYAKATKPHGYIAIARNSPDKQVYCELNGQENGFRSKTLAYSISARVVEFNVGAGEAFDRTSGTRTVEVTLPSRTDIDEVKRCLQAIFP